MKLVEQELWQKEDKGLIGILPVRDAADTMSVGPVLSSGDHDFSVKQIVKNLVINTCITKYRTGA